MSSSVRNNVAIRWGSESSASESVRISSGESTRSRAVSGATGFRRGAGLASIHSRSKAKLNIFFTSASTRLDMIGAPTFSCPSSVVPFRNRRSEIASTRSRTSRRVMPFHLSAQAFGRFGFRRSSNTACSTSPRSRKRCTSCTRSRNGPAVMGPEPVRAEGPLTPPTGHSLSRGREPRYESLRAEHAPTLRIAQHDDRIDDARAAGGKECGDGRDDQHDGSGAGERPRVGG